MSTVAKASQGKVSFQGQQIETGGKYSNHSPGVSTKVKIAVLGFFALYVLSNVQTADAGPLEYAICVAECGASNFGGFFTNCLVGCAHFFTT